MTFTPDNTASDRLSAAQRATNLIKVLRDAPEPTDCGELRRYLAELTEADVALLFIHPNSKAPADLRTTGQRSMADKTAQQAAKDAGRANWARVKSPSGVYLATTDSEVLHKFLDRYIELYGEGVGVNLAINLGMSNLVVVDCDTAAQVSAFLTDAGLAPGTPPTVSTPGMADAEGTMVHSDGGHFYFTVPEGVALPTATGAWIAPGGYVVMWGSRYVLIPPSSRREGTYTVAGEAEVLPEWLLEKMNEKATPARLRAPTAGEGSTSITEWSQTISWSEILAPTRWSATDSVDGCGCGTWTAPGMHASPKSATAHEPGCTASAQFDSDNPPLHIWTDGDDIEPFAPGTKNVSKLQAVALIDYDNNMGAAMAALDLFAEPVTLADPADGGSKPVATRQPGQRRLEITWANTIEPEPVSWLWVDITIRNVGRQDTDQGAVDPFSVRDIACVVSGHTWSPPEVETDGRLACGMVSIAAGREGSGKSSFGIWLAAKITRGLLPGKHYGTPRSIFYLATEDSWKHTLVPRLIAAGADLERVGRVEVVQREISSATLCLPDDIELLADEITKAEAALVVVDPLMSTIGGGLDANASKDVRRALEPLAAMADSTGAAVVAIAHFNKASGLDALSRITGSGAFKDVARAVMVFADDGDERVFTQPKHSVGRSDLPSLTYQINPAVVNTRTGKTSTGVFSFTGWADRSVDEVLADSRSQRTRKSPQMTFIIDYIDKNADPDTGEVELNDVVEAAAAKDYTRKQLINARFRCKDEIDSRSEGFGKDKRTFWSLCE